MSLEVPGSPGLGRMTSIVVTPNKTPAISLNNVANNEVSLEKMTKMEFLAPKEDENLKMFDKTLQSDVSQEEAISLLQKVDEKTSLFREFNFHDMSYLAQVLTILKFNPGDVIIEAGEESSFVGIILSGELQVKFGDVVKPIPSGALLGELSFFEGGTRTAAVSAQSEAVVGMITFNELELLAEYAPTIRLKLMVLFALEGMKKMRMVSAPPPKPAVEAPASTAEEKEDEEKKKAAAEEEEKKKADTASVKSNKRASIDPNANTAEGKPVDTRNRSLKRGGSLAKDGLNLAPGSLKDSAAPAGDDVAKPNPNQRNVEALFRIRMKNEQKAQQEKIERALEKRKKAEHRAQTTSVMVEAYKKDVEKKQEFIEELYQENLDLKEYKAWAQKKHIADAKFLKEKLESFAELQMNFNMETERRKAQEKANEELYKQIDTLVASRTKSYVEQINELQGDLSKRQQRIEAGDKLRATLEENLKSAASQHSLDETRIADILKQVEESRIETTQSANEQIVQHQRALFAVQDELTTHKRNLREIEEKHAALTIWKEEAIELQLQKEMLHQRLHRNLLENVDKHSALQTDVNAYKVILKYVLASILAKNYKRRKHLQSLYLENVDIMRKLNIEVAHYNLTKQNKGAKDTLATVPGGATKGNHPVTMSDKNETNDDGTLMVPYDDHNSDGNSPPNGGEASSGPLGKFNFNSSKAFAQKARIDALFVRVNDLLPSLRTLIDEICSQKIYWNATADSFFRRTIELKQQIMDVEQSTGIKIHFSPTENVALSLANSKGEVKLLDPHAASDPREYHAMLEAANTAPRSNFHYQQESKEESSANNSLRVVGAGKNGRNGRSGTHSPGFPEDDDDDLKPPRSSGGTRRGSVDNGDNTVVHTGPGSVAELRDARDKMVFYKRRCKEYKETNAMLSTRVASFAARLAELEEWQRNLYAHHNAATSVGLIGPFNPPPAPSGPSMTALPPLVNSSHSPASQFRNVSQARSGSMHSIGAHPHQPSSAAVLGVSPTSLLLQGGNVNEHPYVQPESGQNSYRGSMNASNSSGAPVFHIKGGSAGGSMSGASPLNVLYNTLPTQPAPAPSPPNPVAIVLKRNSQESQPPQPVGPSYVIQNSHAHTGPVYTLNGSNSNSATQSLHPHPPPSASTPSSNANAVPASQHHHHHHGNNGHQSYMQHQMAAHNASRAYNGGVPSTPLLVFPPSSPGPVSSLRSPYAAQPPPATASGIRPNVFVQRS